MKTFSKLILCISLFLWYTTTSSGINTTDTRMLSQPAVSNTQVAFIYAEDLWVAGLDGTLPVRLTVDEGVESYPVFSPDGSLIAFTAEYDGNMDVFVIPSTGGIPTRLTWHPGADIVRGFTPDGKNILFTSQRAVFTNRYAQLFTVPVTGGYPVQLTIPNANYATYSPDGRFMAYTPIFDAFQQWKNYRGGTISTILIFSFDDHSVVKIPKPQGGCNDTHPQWAGENIYFTSDRNGEFNLFSYNVKTKEIKQLTFFQDFPVLNLCAADGRIIFEKTGYLHYYDIQTSTARKLTIGIAADLQELRSRFVNGDRYVRSADISPTGARAVFDFRGEIITVPAEKGDPRNNTQTPGAHEKYPAWSPDGKYIAYFSDASGEYKLCIQPQDGTTATKSYSLPGTGFYAFLRWSPDSKMITFTDNGRNFYLFDMPSGTAKKIDADEIYFPGAFRNIMGDWSMDSRWLVYTKLTSTFFKRVFLYSVDQGRSFPVTDGLSDVSEPVFDRGGKYLYFFASTDAGPVINWFDLSNADMRSTQFIYLVTLQKETLSPFARESDEEKIKTETEETAKQADTKKDKKASAVPGKTTPSLTIDLEGLQDRIIALPIRRGNYYNLACSKEEEILYISRPDTYTGTSMLHKYDLKKRKDSEVMEMSNFILSADGTKMLYYHEGTSGIAPAGEKPEPGKGQLKIQDIQVKIDPAAEWAQIFDEAWRINRDYFYDPGMHGTDWNAMKDKYSVFLPDLTCRSDLNRLIQWMCSELAVGHHRVGGGDRPNNPARVNGGLLGADYTIENNRYRLKKIYGGLNWNPDLRSPLTEPGINARPGEYILAVNGRDLTADQNLFSYFENTAGKIVEMTIGPNPDYSDSRIVKVVPVESEYALRNRDWVEGNLKKVTEATNGQVAYVYVPNTSRQGHEYFKRYFFPQANRKAIIIDERFNGGGSIADYYIDLLQKPYQAHWHMRYGQDLKTPSASIQGPKVMIIDETAGSGGDMLPWMFRKFKVGTLVGKRTWGGLVGTLGFPELMDGGYITAPNLAIWTSDGFIVENVGVEPDIEVEQWPADVIAGKDPQLEKAIEVILKELEKNPQEPPARPPYPVRVRK